MAWGTGAGPERRNRTRLALESGGGLFHRPQARPPTSCRHRRCVATTGPAEKNGPPLPRRTSRIRPGSSSARAGTPSARLP